jgi:hypothetical protein
MRAALASVLYETHRTPSTSWSGVSSCGEKPAPLGEWARSTLRAKKELAKGMICPKKSGLLSSQFTPSLSDCELSP